MHILEKHFGLDFFDNLEKEVGLTISKPSNTHFEINMGKGKILDFSVIEKQNVLIIGFPFKVETKRFGSMQYKEYAKFHACPDIKERYIKAIKERLVKYTTGYYTELEEAYIKD